MDCARRKNACSCQTAAADALTLEQKIDLKPDSGTCTVKHEPAPCFVKIKRIVNCRFSSQVGKTQVACKEMSSKNTDIRYSRRALYLAELQPTPTSHEVHVNER